MLNIPLQPDPARLARRALFGFIMTFIAARTPVLLIMSRRIASIAILLVVLVFGIVTYDASVRIGRMEGPRLEALEQASSP